MLGKVFNINTRSSRIRWELHCLLCPTLGEVHGVPHCHLHHSVDQMQGLITVLEMGISRFPNI